MSASLWKYNSEQCDGNSDCCGDCDFCSVEIGSAENDNEKD